MSTVKKIKIGIDLDETLIHNYHYPLKYSGDVKWKIRDDAREWLPKLSNFFEFHCITARNISHSKETLQTLETIERELGISFASKTFTNGNPKGVYALNLRCSAMIDDQEHYLLNCRKNLIIPILLKSKDKELHFKTIEWNQCENWSDIYKKLNDLFLFSHEQDLFIGQLIKKESKSPIYLMRTHLYQLKPLDKEPIDIYTNSKTLNDKYIGKDVKIIGKIKEFELEGTQIREIWISDISI